MMTGEVKAGGLLSVTITCACEEWEAKAVEAALAAWNTRA
jgi:hypothetical protein